MYFKLSAFLPQVILLEIITEEGISLCVDSESLDRFWPNFILGVLEKYSGMKAK